MMCSCKPKKTETQMRPKSPLPPPYISIEISRKQKIPFFFGWWCSLYIVYLILAGLELWAANKKPKPALSSFPPVLAPASCWWTLTATNWMTSRASSRLLWRDEPVQKSDFLCVWLQLLILLLQCTAALGIYYTTIYYTIHNNNFTTELLALHLQCLCK